MRRPLVRRIGEMEMYNQALIGWKYALSRPRDLLTQLPYHACLLIWHVTLSWPIRREQRFELYWEWGFCEGAPGLASPPFVRDVMLHTYNMTNWQDGNEH